MSASMEALFRAIPSIDHLLNTPAVHALHASFSEEVVKQAVRRTVEELRVRIRSGAAELEDCAESAVAQQITENLHETFGPKLRKVINATGVIIHTNLGRSPLSRSAAQRIYETAIGYSNLEYDLSAGRRGERNAHVRTILSELTGAESAIVVNNNAAAVLIALNSLAQGREVVVSRGELIEIGGSFRIPDVMTASGAVLRETGTTNRTHPKDYRSAIGPNTALILKVHTSNYRITGFTKEIGLEELVLIGREHGVPTMMDLGSGCLVDLSPFGFSGEVPVGAIIKAGVDVVTFSGDKLLGGPQAGIIVGRADLIEKMRRNPLARALRMDKLTLAGLSAVLEDYASHEGPFRKIPTLNMIAKSAAELEQSAHTLADALQRALSDSAVIGIEQGVGRVGGGSLPMEDLPGPRVSLRPARVSAASLERRLRLGAVPVIVLVKNEAVLMDPRTLMPEDLEALPALIAHAMGG